MKRWGAETGCQEHTVLNCRPHSQPQVTGRDITFSAFYEAPGQTLYWKMPAQFLGNKVTSYGGTLKYTIKYSGSGPLNTDADVILRVSYLVHNC